MPSKQNKSSTDQSSSNKPPRTQPTTIVIGGGLAGLATAALLAKEGHQVTLLEKNSQLGGRAQVWKKQGFLFDMGPSWYMMPKVFEDFWKLFGKNINNYLNLKKLEPRFQVILPNQQKIKLTNNLQQNKQIFNQLEKGAGQQLANYLSKTDALYQLVVDKLLYYPYRNWLDYLKPAAIKHLLNLITILNPLQSYHSLVKKHFQNTTLQQILEFPSVFLGGDPRQTPAVYSLLSTADFTKKIWYPMGGMTKLIEALSKLAQEEGVTIKTDSPVSSITCQNGRASGVVVNNQHLPADYVISCADYAHTELQLLNQQNRQYDQDYWESKDLAISAMLIFLGVRGKIKNLEHHNLYFNPQWEDHFDTIFNNPGWPRKPSYYVGAPSVTDPSVAPANHENLFVLVPLAPGLDDNDEQRQKYADHVIDHLEQTMQIKLRENIKVQRIFSQRDFAKEYNAYRGTALALAHTLGQSLHLRPNLRSSKLPNLFYAGQYTQPGVGVPMTIISAQLVKQLITTNHDRN